jgi:hypothetical protein
MKSTLKNDPAQMVFPVFCPVVSNLGNGTFKVDFGKPHLWLKPSQLAAQFGVDRDTVYRWIAEGVLPEKIKDKDGVEVVLVEKAGLRKYRINSAAVTWLKARFREGLQHEKAIA